MSDTTTSKERPILFSGPMVRAILEGRKSQTRRVVKHWEEDGDIDCNGVSTFAGYVPKWPSPHGKPGDRLWVRETFCSFVQNGVQGAVYRADTEDGFFSPCETLTGGYPANCLHHQGCEGCTAGRWKPNWRPSIHMPRWASRIALEITGIRVERLQDISESDAKAEGVTLSGGWNADGTNYGVNYTGAFSHLWNSINSKRAGCAWADNPWVWVIEFKRIEP